MLISSPLHLQLKSSTDAIHEALHQDPLLSRLTRRDCTNEEYRAILRIFFLFYAKNEKRFSQLHEVRFAAEAPVLQWLEQDLTVLGELPITTHFEVDKTPASFSEYIGYLYIKQGSTLGGQVLCRHLINNLGLGPEKGLRFFSGFGDATRQHWVEFLHYLEERQTVVDVPTAVVSANNYFRQLQTLFAAQT